MSGNTKEYAEEIKSPNPFHQVVVHIKILPKPEQFRPQDARDFTARFFGDPIPGDRRREMFPGKEHRVGWRGLAR